MGDFGLYEWWGGLPRFVRFGTALLTVAAGGVWLAITGPEITPIVVLGTGVILTIAAIEIRGD